MEIKKKTVFKTVKDRKLKKKQWLPLGIVEGLAGLGLILGVYTQVSALVLSVVMLGAIYMKTMKWKVPFTTMTGTGWEFDLILLAANLFILASGPSLYSLLG